MTNNAELLLVYFQVLNATRSIIQYEYNDKLRREDDRWADTFRALALKLKKKIDGDLVARGISRDQLDSHRAWQVIYSLPFYVARYPPERFVGLGVGHPGTYDSFQLKPKIYLQLRDHIEDLSPEKYLKFTNSLST